MFMDLINRGVTVEIEEVDMEVKDIAQDILSLVHPLIVLVVLVDPAVVVNRINQGVVVVHPKVREVAVSEVLVVVVEDVDTLPLLMKETRF